MTRLNPTSAPYQFHGTDFSYFTGKVRPALRYKGLWVEELRADFGEILKRTGLTFMPVVFTPEGETWQDSTDIYDHLEVRHPDPPLFPATPVQRMAAHLVELYVDEFALLPAMHYRWATELGHGTTEKRFASYIGDLEKGKAGASRMAGARVALGATDEAAEVIEAHTVELLAALSAHFESHPFLLGGRMSFADCAMMGPFYGHFFNDLVSRQLLLESAWRVVGWIEKCNFPNQNEQTHWLEGDEIAPTLHEVLRVMGEDAAPVFLAAVRKAEETIDGQPGDVLGGRGLEVPAFCETELRGQPIRKMALPYSLYMLQRTIDAYRALTDDERKQVEGAIAGTGWEPVLAYEPKHRVEKKDFKLVLAEHG